MADEQTDPQALWIVPSSLARRQIEHELARRRGLVRGLRVWTWIDLWREVRAGLKTGPGWLSPSGVRAVLGLAIDRARRDGLLREVGALAETSGYRRRLQSRIAAWTRAEFRSDDEPPLGADRDEWSVFFRYRRYLKQIDAEDAEGFSVWASRRLFRSPPSNLRTPGNVILLDPSRDGRAAARALSFFSRRSATIRVLLPWDPEEGREEVFADIAPIREALLNEGFLETRFTTTDDRPAGLLGIERGLFRLGPSPNLNRTDGLSVQGAPEGEGAALAVAGRVRECLRSGCDPDDVVVVVPRWSEQGERVRETLRSWGIPASAEIAGSLAREPVIATLRAAMRVAVDGWEASSVIHLLQNGRLRPDWSELRDPGALAMTAKCIRETRVFRGREPIREALRRASLPTHGEDDRRRLRRAERAQTALAVFDRLCELLGALDRPATWRVQNRRLRALAETLNLAADDAVGLRALEHLWNILDDHATVQERLGKGEEILFWSEFTHEVESIIRDVSIPSPAQFPGEIRIATVDEIAGVSARHLVLTDLAEGTFPARDVIDRDPTVAQAEVSESSLSPLDRAYAREMRRFLDTVNSARASLTLIYPTTDEKGQSLLAAGFLEDVRRLFAPETWAECHAEVRRLTPILPASMVGSPAEWRVRTVGLALEGRAEALKALAELASSRRHRPSLDGTATALLVSERRLKRKGFGRYDGRLSDPAILRRIAEDFGPNRLAFSPSQLESFALCPFQFFQRYVLRLEPTDDREELEDDYAGRGSLIHSALETLHTRLRDEPSQAGESLAERVKASIQPVIRLVLEHLSEPISDVDAGLRRIEAERLERTGRRYASQFEAYSQSPQEVECHLFEVAFGKASSPHEGLVLGTGNRAVGLQGMIDRIDVVRTPDRTLFRVIDYKTGSCPGSREVESGLAMQLPLYAMAVEQVILKGEEAAPLDVAYWALRDKGFKRVKKMAEIQSGTVTFDEDWRNYLQRLEVFVLELVDRLRRACFPVHPRLEDCTRFCDYRSVCRIAQVRHASKTWEDAPSMGADS